MAARNCDSIRRWIAIIPALGMLAPLNSPAEIIDYHQHLYSPEAGARSSPGPKGIDAGDLVAQLDAAGIKRAVVLSVAYSFSNPNKQSVPNEYAHVMRENNWTNAQVAKYSQRLLGFCSVNPLRPYALDEIARCAKDPNLSTGLKLHFGNSDVNVNIPDHLARVRRVFSAANKHHMAIVVHMHSNIDHHRPYGAKEARIFLEQLLPEAPDVVVQIAHLAGGGGYDDPATDAALSVFVEAIERRDPRMKNVYFDVCGIAIPGTWENKADLVAQRIRQIGTNRLLYGSDAATTGYAPKLALKRWRSLPYPGKVRGNRKQRRSLSPKLARGCGAATSWVGSHFQTNPQAEPRRVRLQSIRRYRTSNLGWNARFRTSGVAGRSLSPTVRSAFTSRSQRGGTHLGNPLDIHVAGTL